MPTRMVIHLSLELSSEKAVCYKCGAEFSRHKGYFPVSYALLHKGVGYIPVCKECIDTLYNSYLAQCNDAKNAVRQVCRKLDLYWSGNVFEIVSRKSTTRSMMTQYIAKINSITYAGKSYDDTLSEEGSLWNFAGSAEDKQNVFNEELELNDNVTADNTDDVEIPESIVNFWGSGYPKSMYLELEKRRVSYISRLQNGNELDIGSESLVRQICILEVMIARDSAAGRSIDKNVNALNSLLGSLNLKPTQRRNEDAEAELSSTPLGVWLYRYENKRPLPEIDDQLKDVNHLKKYIFTWMGHICKMLGIKNGFTKLYEEEIERLRVDKPEYEDEDEEDLIINSYSESESD